MEKLERPDVLDVPSPLPDNPKYRGEYMQVSDYQFDFLAEWDPTLLDPKKATEATVRYEFDTGTIIASISKGDSQQGVEEVLNKAETEGLGEFLGLTPLRTDDPIHDRKFVVIPRGESYKNEPWVPEGPVDWNYETDTPIYMESKVKMEPYMPKGSVVPDEIFSKLAQGQYAGDPRKADKAYARF